MARVARVVITRLIFEGWLYLVSQSIAYALIILASILLIVVAIFVGERISA